MLLEVMIPLVTCHNALTLVCDWTPLVHGRGDRMLHPYTIADIDRLTTWEGNKTSINKDTIVLCKWFRVSGEGNIDDLKFCNTKV